MRYLVFLICLPSNLIIWPIILFCNLFWGTAVMWCDSGLWCMLKEDTWFSKNWAGITLGHGGFYGHHKIQSYLNSTVYHEKMHVIQHEAACLTSLVIGIIALLAGCNAFIFLLIWALGWGINYGAASVVGKIRGKKLYTGNIHELGAYALTYKYEKENVE